MLPLLLALFGATGTLYLLYKWWWKNRYLDWVYQSKSTAVRNNIFECVKNKKFLVDIFEESAKRDRKKTFIIYRDRSYSYEFMDKRANQVGRTGIEIGVQPGSVIAVLMYNEPNFVSTYLGFMKVGYQIAYINFNLRSKSLAHCINASGARVLLVGGGPKLAQNVEEILCEIPTVMVYYMGTVQEPKPGPFLSWDLVMSRTPSDPIDKSVRKHVKLATTNIFIYTSGTTGLPKPALVTHFRCLKASFALGVFGFSSEDILYQTLPMYHSAALLVGFANVVSKGATMILEDKFSASHFWEDCRKYNATTFQYIGEICRYLLAKPRTKDDGNHTIKYAYGNGLRQDIWAEFQQRFKIPQIIELYGATECPVVLVNLTNKIGACGRSSPALRQTNPAAFVKYDIEAQAPLRNKHGRCVPIGPDEVGLLVVPLIEGRTAFSGYLGRKEESEKKMLYDVFEEGDRFYNSGDLMRVDRDYYVYFSDRVGDTFRWKGENVSTTEVSNMLTDLDFIHDANVYGVLLPGGDGRAGMASLTLTYSNLDNLSTEMVGALSKHVQNVLPVYARPKFIRVQREFDMTSTYKQQKMALVSEGFDINIIQDPVYFLNPSNQTYEPLKGDSFKVIMAGKMHF